MSPRRKGPRKERGETKANKDLEKGIRTSKRKTQSTDRTQQSNPGITPTRRQGANAKIEEAVGKKTQAMHEKPRTQVREITAAQKK